jgi:hypothetical protein
MTLRKWGIALSLWLTCSATVCAQTVGRPIGTWRAYLNTSKGIDLAYRDQEIWAATTGGLLRFNRETEELRAFTTVEGLSDINTTAMAYLPATDQLVAGYDDGRIDYFSDPRDIRVLTDIQRSTTYTDKRINAFASDQQRLYVATNFGLVVYELESLRPIADVAQFGNNPSNVPVINVQRFEGRVYVLLENNTLHSIPADFPNLRDRGAWEAETMRSNLSVTDTLRDIGVTDFGLFAITTNTTLRKQNQTWATYEALTDTWSELFTGENYVAVSRQGLAVVYTADSTRYSSSVIGTIVGFTYLSDGVYYQVMANEGLNRISGGTRTDYILPGPGSNESVGVAAGNGELYIAPIGYDQIFIPRFLGSGIYYYRNGEGWNNLSANEDLPVGVQISYARATYDPATQRAYLGSWVGGMTIIESGVVQEAFTCENSTIGTVSGACVPGGSNDTRVSGMQLDLNGNLWVSTYLGAPPLTVRDAAGTWHELPRNRFPTDVAATRLEVDSYGNAWIVNSNKNLLVYTSNGTPDVFDDGVVLTFNTGENQGSLPSAQVLSVAEDLDGFIWVGTSQGVSVIYDPFSVSQGNVVEASEPIVGEAPLLSNTEVNAIAIDGGNRKWFGTSDGVFLVSPEGDNVITQFTAENSPLLSNRVLDLAIDQSTGEVFIATVNGVVSFLGDATAGTAVCEDVTVYPNPVFTDYDGPIVIRGTVAESVVKITTISGLLVREVPALGGQATWDGRDIRGRQVRSGVYLALIADENGENDCIGKFVVISRGAR